MANAKHAIQRKAVTNTVAQQTETTTKHAIQVKPLTNTVAQQTMANAQQTMANAQQIATVAAQTVTFTNLTWRTYIVRYIIQSSVDDGILLDELEFKIYQK